MKDGPLFDSANSKGALLKRHAFRIYDNTTLNNNFGDFAGGSRRRVLPLVVERCER